MRYDGKAAFTGHGFQVHVGPMRAKSRGFVRVRSKDAREAPQILFNYLTHPDDLPEWRRAVRLTRELFQQPAMQRYAAEEIQPGPKVSTRRARSTPSSASIARAPTTPAAPARWARRTIRWRWSTPNAG